MTFLGAIKPTKVKYKGVVYKVHDDFRNVLNTIRMLEEEDDEVERAIILIQTILGSDATLDLVMLNKANQVLWNGVDPDTVEQQEVHQDLIQDYPIYKMDILREFNKDIEKMEYLSWSEYLELVGSLSKDSNLAQVVQIRSTKEKDIPKDKRREFKKLQERFAIKNKVVEQPKETIFDKWMERSD